jgi:hypothetical protein
MSQNTLHVAALIFLIAVLHTFSVGAIKKLGHRFPEHEGAFHLLSEVEAVFGIWSIVLFGWLLAAEGLGKTLSYADSRNYTEPLFVFVIMVIAASRPIMLTAKALVEWTTRLIPANPVLSRFFVIISCVPLMGSLITEPAAMTLAALMLLNFFGARASNHFKYATLGVLFVNVSIGGTLTNFAAPPVLMVASKWEWSSAYMLNHFGWKAFIAIAINSLALTLIFRKQLASLHSHDIKHHKNSDSDAHIKEEAVPWTFTLIHLLCVGGVVMFAHHASIFMGIFLLFLGISIAYPQYQDRLIIREGLMVSFFLAGLVFLGGLQAWWLQPLLSKMSPESVYFGATALTAVTDNAALTYLGSLVEGLSEEFKYMLVAGAVTGGGLTIIANAPNPAGAAVLKVKFEDENLNPGPLFLAALGPTIITILCFLWLPKTLW